MNKKRRLTLAVLYNLMVFVLTIFCVLYSFIFGTFGNMTGALKYEVFKYFTIDSNLLLAFSALLMAIDEILILKGRKVTYNKFIYMLKFVSTVAVLLTFTTVVFFLSIIYSPLAMFVSSNLFFHLINPLMSLFILLFLEKDFPLGKFGVTFLGLIPMVIYGIIYFLMVLVFKVWDDFYAFTLNNMTICFIILMPTVTYGLSVLTYELKRKLSNGDTYERIS